ncbi:MAG: HIT family protein [Phycisphaerae bacterium]|nr:HIT family protein [Phycisphaerae bacterium]
MSAGDCIFCRIVAGEIPARKVFEDAVCMAFLDVAPLAPGHCLVVPKGHFGSFDQMPADIAGAMLSRLPMLGKAVQSATGSTGFNVLLNNGKVAGQEVMHVHVHVIPRKEGDGLGYRWHPQSLDDATADSLRSRIADGLDG